MAHPDVPAEQAHVDQAYQRLAEMRASTQATLVEALGESGRTFQAVTERDIRVRNSLTRLGQLDIGDETLVFGRIDRTESPEAFHIGRLAISDYQQEPLVVDWRAPVAEPFYRATGAHPMGLARRRHFLTEGRRVIDLEDELFDAEHGEPGVGLGLSGSQVLLTALSRARTGRMRDIVATIQREQDEVIRGPLAGVLVVQGGPGTGKTAVALHRAAYLLYTHRFPLETQGVLVVGPNPTFLRYIEHVLPSLDENGVELSTVGGLYPGARSTGKDDDETAAVKGDARMARLMARAVRDRERPLRATIEVPYGKVVLRITRELSAEVVGLVKRRPGTHNARRRLVETTLWRRLADQVPSQNGLDPEGEGVDPEELGRAIRRQPAVVEALHRMWPLLTPEEMLRDLFGSPALIDLAAGDLLTTGERKALWRERGSLGTLVGWTDSDLPLLDEAAALLGPRSRRDGGRDDGFRRYGHVVVDEAQDLTPMQLRMLGRRSLSGSMTVVGDISQATGAWVPSSWSEIVRHMGAPRGWRQVELTINYRTPSEIMELASRVLHAVSPSLRSPEAVRSTGIAPRMISAGHSAAGSIEGQTVGAVATELAALQSDGAQGTVGVIAPAALLDLLEAALSASSVTVGRVGRRALDESVSLLAVEDAKGLEFDSVIVVEPAHLRDDPDRRLRADYVAFTRATQRLTIIHSGDLPVPLRAAG